MLDYKVKIGIVPNVRDLGDFETRRGMFEPAKGVENKERAISYIRSCFENDKNVFCDLEWLNDRGVLYKNADCEKVCAYFKKENVDAIFIMNCNFGNEEACGRVAKEMNLPVLLWGPQDTIFDSDGQRYTDAQCGLFAISKQLRRYGIPFSYIENSPVESEVFADGFRRFLSVVCMVKNFKKLTVTQIGTRLNPFKSVMCNEMELTEKFGFNLNTVNMALFEKKFQEIQIHKETEIQRLMEEVQRKYDTSAVDEETLYKMTAFTEVYREVFTETEADVLTSECWSAMPMAVGALPCLAMSILADSGYIVTCESDVHGAVTNALLACAARGERPPIFGEFTTRHPQNKNAELLWHCGPFPYSVKHSAEQAKIVGGKPSFRAKDGMYTIARFQGDAGSYTLLGGRYRTTEGPKTFGTYMWAEFQDLPQVEKKLIYGPYIHHMSEMEGDFLEALQDFCNYIPNLTFDLLENNNLR